uniref:Uncharacterized protein n=1 Tax=Fagus sylvatica TaxID=28930 RepID=A0A2N9FSH1_FAGSY
MEGAPNDGTSADPAMTPIERQMQGTAKLRELRPAAGTERKAQEVPLHLANIRQLKQRGRPNSQNDQIGRPSSLSEKIDGETPPRQPDHPDRSTRDPDDKTARLEKELREMRKQMGDMKNSLRAKAARNLDNLVHRADSPFIPSIADFPLPSRFKVPLLENFDGTKDPFDYLEAFKTIMQLQAVPEEVMCRAFPLGLRGSARVWFNKLESESIGSFVQLSRAFIDHFIGSQRRGRPPTHLLSVKQMEGESLRTFVHRFNEEAMKIDRPKEDVTVTAFMAGRPRGYGTTHHRKGGRKLKDRKPEPSKQKVPKFTETPERKRTTAPPVKFSSFTPLNTPIDKLTLADTRRPITSVARRVRSLEGTNRDTHPAGQTAEEKSEPSLEDQHQEEPQEPQGKHMRGKYTTSWSSSAHQRTSASTTRSSLSAKKDARGTHQPHDDALVITINIAGFTTRRVMVDNGSSADILYLPAYQQMRLDKDKLRPMDAPLVGFTGDKVCPVGIVTLPITVGTHPKTVSKTVDFLVVNCPSAYNAIIGRPTLNRLRAVTSTYHLLLKFPTEHGIGEVRGDQIAARECYLASLGSGGQNQTMSIEEQKVLVKPSGELDTIELEDGRPERTTKIGADLPPKIKESLVQFLKDNKDVFAWSHEDMPGINPSIISHKLNVDPSLRPIKQKRRVFAPERNNAIMEEVDKLLAANFIREVFYPDWLANVVMRSRRRPPFITSRGLFCYKVMPFGLKNAGATYQRLMNRMFHDQIGRNVEVYVDDMLVKSKEEDGPPGRPQRDFPNTPQIPDEAEPKRRFEWTGRSANKHFEELKKTQLDGLIQWSIELSEFDIDYRPRTAIKAQALADFIAEFTSKDDEPTEDVEQASKWTVNIDGSSTKDSGGVGIVLRSPEGDIIKQAIRLQYPTTNNEAEYEALLLGLKTAKILGATELDVRSDSQLVVGQVNGDYEAKEGRMQQYLQLVRHQISQFREVRLCRVPREQNTEADQLAKSASSSTVDDKIKTVQQSSLQTTEVNPIHTEISWMTPIISYLQGGTLPDDRHEARRLKVRASRFLMLQGTLYKRGFSLPYLRCLAPDEANYVMREIHEGVCGDHSGARALQRKIVRAGYYWPSMKADTYQFVQRCDKCQRGGLDIMGPLPIGRRQLKFLVVAIDYFTKWVEAEPLATITERNIQNFVWKAVICRFGIPRVLVSDNGKQFDNPRFRQFSQELGIHNHYSSPGHPQANGQVEVTNRSLLKLIKTRLEGAKGLWPEELPSILWAYRTTVRIPTGETPFRMTFGSEAVVPVEIGLTTFRTSAYDGQENEEQLRLNLDLIDEVRETAEARMKRYQEKMARHYNSRVKPRQLSIGDLVLRKVTLATRNPSEGKLGPNWEGPYKVIEVRRPGTYHLEDMNGRRLPHPWNAEHLRRYYP